MKDLFYMGGPLFMSILTLLLIGNIVWIIYHLLASMKSSANKEKVLELLAYSKSIGMFALVTGILGQLIGLYMAFTAIEAASDISPAIIFGGIKVSMITTLYGMFIYLISLLLWFISDMLVRQKLSS